MKLRAKRQWSAIIGLVFASIVLELNVVSGFTLPITAAPATSAGQEKAGESLEKETTVITAEKDSNVVSPGQDTTIITSGQDSTVSLVTSGQDSTAVTSGQDSTVGLVTSGQDSTAVSSGQDSTVGLVTSGKDSTAVSSGQDTAVDLVTSGQDSTVGLVTSGQDSTVGLGLVTSGQDSTAVTSGEDSTLETTGQDSTVVISGQDSTVVTSGQDSTVVTTEKGSTTVTRGNESTLVYTVNVTTAPGNETTVVSSANESTTPGNNATVVSSANNATTPVNSAILVSPVNEATLDSSENEITNDSTGNKTDEATRVKRTGDESTDSPDEGAEPGDSDEESPDEGAEPGDSDEESPGAEGTEQTAGEPQFLNSVALINWVQSASTDSSLIKFLTVGAVIASNAIVCVPSARVPVKENDVRNWYVHSVYIGEPQTTIEKKDLVLIFHPHFKMSRDSSHRIALIMVNSDVFQKMPRLTLVAEPLVPSFETTRHDVYGLANCKLVVVDDNQDGVDHIDFSAFSCRYSKSAKKVYGEKICGLPKMMEDQKPAMVRKNSFPRDLGSPLICGKYLVGVYAGVQNIGGNRDKDDQSKQRTLGSVNLLPHEQYTFDIPGAPRNYKFVSGYVNQTHRNMRWTHKLEVRGTHECMSKADEELVRNQAAEGGTR